MDLGVITMPQDEAAAAAERYRRMIKDPKIETDRVDEAALRGYRQLAKADGALGLISLEEAFRRAGRDELGRPKLAISRADRPVVLCEVTTGGALTFGDTRETVSGYGMRWDRRDRLVASDGRRIRLPAGTLEASNLDPHHGRAWRRSELRTRVPRIPPEHRPDGSLSRFHVLFEVDEWEELPAPDPALLRHLGGDLWLVLAVWELTPIERRALALQDLP